MCVGCQPNCSCVLKFEAILSIVMKLLIHSKCFANSSPDTDFTGKFNVSPRISGNTNVSVISDKGSVWISRQQFVAFDLEESPHTDLPYFP